MISIAVGCGGSDDIDSPDLPQGKQSTLPVSPPPVAAPNRAVAPAVRPRAKPKRDGGKQSESEVELTSNDYLLSRDPQTFELASAEEIATHHSFAVSLPKFDSRTMVINEPEVDPRPRTAERPTLTLPKGFNWIIDDGLNADGYPHRVVSEQDSAEMILIEGGVFTQGTDAGDANSTPLVHVYVSAFYIDTVETTWGQYRKFLAEQRPSSSDSEQRSDESGPEDDYPVTGLPYKEVQRYVAWTGKQLPTEAEWERAARGPDGNLYPWGNGRPPTAEGFLNDILPVKSRPTDLTPSGLFDMASNAREWVTDWYDSEIYQSYAKRPGSPVRDPQGPKIAEILGERVVRGSRTRWELWKRDHANLKRSADDIGFRAVLRITDDMLPERESPRR